MKKLSIKTLSLILSIILILSVIPVMNLGITASAADDYPYRGGAIDATDNWRFCTRECTSFCAWRLNNNNGVAFTNYYGGVTWGDAKDWGYAASRIGIAVNMTPAVGAIAWWNNGTYGHVAWVSAVNGSSVTIEEYNYPAYSYNYNVRTISSSSVSGYIHIKDIQTDVGQPISGGSQIVSDGYYHIVSALNTNYGVDVANNSNIDGTNIQLYNNTTDNNQLFYLKYLGDGFYSIKHKSSGKMVDVDGGNLKYGTNVNLYQSNNTNAQKWVIEQTGDGYFYIRSKCNGLCLDIKDEIVANGTNIQVWPKNGTNAQKWAFIAAGEAQTVSNGTYHIVSALNENYGMDVNGNSSTDETNVQLYKNTTDSKQTFTLKYLGNGYYSITHTGTNKALDIYSNSRYLHANVDIYTPNNTDAQKFVIKNAGNGYYKIIAKGSGLCLDVEDEKASNGANIQGYFNWATKAQMWKFVCATHIWNNGTITKTASCTQAGVKTFHCSKCEEIYTQELPALGHDYEDVVTLPTRDTQGYTTHTCRLCNQTFEDTYVPALTGSAYYIVPALIEQNTTLTVTCGDKAYTINAENGIFETSMLPAGDYTIYAKQKNSLRMCLDTYHMQAGEYINRNDILLPVGDVNEDDVIDMADISLLLAGKNYATQNEALDLTGDTLITIADLALVLQDDNYGKKSDLIV